MGEIHMRAGKVSHSHSLWALVVQWGAGLFSVRRRSSSHIVGGRSGLPFWERQVDGISLMASCEVGFGPRISGCSCCCSSALRSDLALLALTMVFRPLVLAEWSSVGFSLGKLIAWAVVCAREGSQWHPARKFCSANFDSQFFPAAF